MGEEVKHGDLTSIESRFSKHKMFVLVSSSIIVALLLVIVSMALYSSSGAAQLDLSRPGYQSVQDKLGRSDTFESFPTNGPVNSQTFEQFLRLYDRQIKSVQGSSPFNPESLSDHNLGIDSPS